MSPEAEARHWQLVERLFRSAVDAPDSQRDALIEDLAAGDRAAEADVRRLLRAHAGAGAFLETLDAAGVAALLDASESDLPNDGFRDPASIGRYRIVRRLGSGGMGIVYLARDERLDRDVALKLLPPRMVDTESKRRLTAEARAASALDHPAIATIYEVGETEDGQPFIAMAAYAGETLRERLRRGPVPAGEAVDLACSIAAGLGAAHERGIIHRDIKPANIILTPTGPRIVDFGVAKVAGADMTSPGVTLGTIAYMSPEQTTGTTVDARTDIWSLGVVLHEMLTGRNPFARPTDRATIQAIRHDPPESIDRTLAPPAVSRVVERCLRKDPALRYAAGGPLADALVDAGRIPAGGRGRRVVLGALGFVALAAGAIAVATSRTDTPPDLPVAATAGAPLVLAVLPFDGSGGAAADIYFAEGMTTELMARLATLEGVHVIARPSVAEYLQAGGTLAEIGAGLGVQAVLRGEVRPGVDTVEVSAMLLDARTGSTLWTATYAAPRADQLSVQEEIGRRVAAALPIPGRSGDQRRITGIGTDDPAAYDAYLRGRYHWNRRNPESLRLALEQFQASLSIDPLFSRAWAGLAETYDMLASTDVLPAPETYPVARAAAERALALDSTLAEAHTALATLLTTYAHDWQSAEDHFRRALAANPSYVIAHQRYAALLQTLGNVDEGIAEARRAQELDPLSPYARAGVGYALYLARRHDEAIAQLRTARTMDPVFGLTYINLALAELAAGDAGAAVATLETLDSLWTDAPVAVGLLGHAYARSGRATDAEAMLNRLHRIAARQPVSAFHFAVLHVGAGDASAALAALDTAVTERASLVNYLAVEPVFDRLRGLPDFHALLERLGLHAVEPPTSGG